MEDILDLSGFEESWADRVTFYLGCSFTFEMALNNHGIPMKNMNLGRNASMYLTNIGLKQAGAFNADMIVTMRPIRKSQISEAFLISAQYPTSHGAPVHMGNPGRIGVTDLGQPTAGDTCEVEEDEVPVFWACGFTVSQAVMNAGKLASGMASMVIWSCDTWIILIIDPLLFFFFFSTAAPQLAFTHYSGSMFITDIQAQPKSIGDDFDVVVLSREHQPFFASVLEKRSVNTMHKLEKAILDDQGGRGVSHLYQESDLLKSVLSLSHAKRVAITTGFPVHTELEVKEETDGLPGALSICQALLALDKEVILIADSGTVGLYQSCADHMTELKVLKSAVKVIPYSSAVEILQNGRPDSPPWDCLLAIERAGRAKDGSYHTMKAKTVSVEPVDDLFIMAESNPLISTISIGDGGNELGMGKVYEQVVKYIPHGETIACTTATDFVIVAGVSNWAGYAVSLGLYVLSHSPIHWRYRNHAVDTDRIVTYELDNFLPTGDKVG